MYEFDEIDRALFALPLEDPPPGLRQSILNCTVNAPAAVRSAALAWWELLGIGAVAALAVWLAVGAVRGTNLGSALTSALIGFGHSLADPGTLAWLTVGATVSLWLTFISLRPANVLGRFGRS
jgi:Na+/phosphate symporter